jgi:hypothetical protein
MIDRFLEKNKKLIILCLLILFTYLTSLFFLRNRELFCPTGTPSVSYECLSNIKSGFALPMINLFPYIFSSMLLLFFVSDRLKRNAIIAIVIISFPILFLTFNSPINCGGWIDLFCSRVEISLLLRNFYPIITVLTLAISGIYFYLIDKRAIKKGWVVTLTMLSAFILLLPLVILFMISI